MTDQQYLIKNLLIGAAELGAATQRKYDHPRLDLITQREAYKFFEERDTVYGEVFTHGEAWGKVNFIPNAKEDQITHRLCIPKQK